MSVSIESLKRKKRVRYKSKVYTVVLWSIDKNGACRVEIIEGEWNPFWVNLSKLEP